MCARSGELWVERTAIHMSFVLQMREEKKVKIWQLNFDKIRKEF